MMNDHHQENLYQIPSCSICLSEMTQILSALDCGHVFHTSCLSQHLQYRGTCPNCQKRAVNREIKPVFFPLVKNTQSATMMRQILGSISTQQREQVQELFQKLKTANVKSEKLENDLKQAQKQCKKQKKQLDETKTSLNRTKHQLQTIKKDIIQLKQVIEHLHIQNKRSNQENFNLNLTLQDYKEKQSQYEKYKTLKRKTIENSQALILYKQELEAKPTPDKQIAKIFFDMIMIKNLEVLKLKNSMEIFPHKITQKQEQISQLKQKLQRQKKQVKELLQKNNIFKKKYEDLKGKYRNLAQKYKSKCQQTISDEDNYQDSMLSRPSFPLYNNTSVISKPNTNKSILIKQQNVSNNENRALKKNTSGFFDSIIEEEEIKQGSKNNQIQKKSAQQSLNAFVTPKNNFVNNFGSFGGIGTKKKPEEKKTSMKNLFFS